MKIEAKGISRRYFRNGKGTNFFYAVEKTDFAQEGESLVMIVGRSGSGKTTFINMLSGLLEPSEGQVLINGEDLYALDDDRRSYLRNRSIGIIPQGQTGLQSLTVLENVLAPACMYGNGADKEDRARMLLKEMETDQLENVYSNELSGGELRRMAIARALINDPELIIADEPTGDLDDETTEKVLRLLRRKADSGALVIMVTHESGALEYADRVYRMEKGVLTEQ